MARDLEGKKSSPAPRKCPTGSDEGPFWDQMIRRMPDGQKRVGWWVLPPFPEREDIEWIRQMGAETKTSC